MWCRLLRCAEAGRGLQVCIEMACPTTTLMPSKTCSTQVKTAQLPQSPFVDRDYVARQWRQESQITQSHNRASANEKVLPNDEAWVCIAPLSWSCAWFNHCKFGSIARLVSQVPVSKLASDWELSYLGSVFKLRRLTKNPLDHRLKKRQWLWIKIRVETVLII